MAAPSRTLLPDLPKGHRFSDTSFQVTAEHITRYLEAVEDANSLYLERGLAPPLAVTARALASLLDAVELPPGALHTSQEVASHAGVSIGSTLTLSAEIVQRSERAGMVISVIAFEAKAEGSDTVAVAGRTMIIAPADASVLGGTS